MSQTSVSARWCFWSQARHSSRVVTYSVLGISMSSSPLRSEATLAAERHRLSTPLLPARIERREDLPDGPDVIGRMGGGGERGGGAHAVPAGARGDDLPPGGRFVTEPVAQRAPLILGTLGVLPAGAEVGARERIRLAGGPAVQDGEAEPNVIDMGGD